MKIFRYSATVLFAVALGAASAGCNILGLSSDDSGDDDPLLAALAAVGSSTASKSDVLTNYANLVWYTSSDALTAMKSFQTKVDAFVLAPTAAGLTDLQTSYTEARRIYLLIEATRFSSGPIDTSSVLSINGGEVEGLLNAWPVDEGNIDTVFIAGSTTIDATNLLAQNGIGGDEGKVTVGWHAIEYMLWGDDGGVGANTYNQTAGQRSSSDFSACNGCTPGTNQPQSRSKFLKAATDLMVTHMTQLAEQWNPDTMTNYRNGTFLVASNQDQMLTNIITGLASFAQGEWGGERLNGLTSGLQQEDEHSCFSDLTKEDFFYDAQGVINIFSGVYTGTSGSTTGPGIQNLVSAFQGGSTIASINAALVAGRDQFVSTTTWRYDSVINSSRTTEEAAILAQLQETQKTIVGLGTSFTSFGSLLGYTITPTSP